MTESTSGKTAALITPGFLIATVLIVALFFFWGVSNSLNDVLIPQFRKTFLLGDFASSLVQFATFIGYFVFAIPGFAVHAAFRLSRRGGHGSGVVRHGRAVVLSGGAARRISLVPGARCSWSPAACLSSRPPRIR